MNRKSLYMIFLCLFITISVYAEKIETAPPQNYHIVILSSYSPEVKYLSENLTDFYKECKAQNITNDISIEDLNAKNLPECIQWKERLWKIIGKYYEKGRPPVLFILLGPEATSAYLSLDKPELKSTPIIIGKNGRYITKLPKDNTLDLKSWNPPHSDLTKDFNDYNIVGGYVYNYDFKKNLELIRFFYPKRDNLYFLTDNTLGGMALLSVFKEYIKKDDYSFKVNYLDGRKLSYLEVAEALGSLENNSVVLTATWRIDNTDSFSVSGASYTFGDISKHVPTFSVSSIGMGHWPVGGYTPGYRPTGKFLAQEVAAYLKTGHKKPLSFLENKYVFDYQRLRMLKLSLNRFMDKYEMVNKPVSFYEQYTLYVWLATFVFCIITVSFFTLLYYFRRNKLQTLRILSYSRQMVELKNIAENANKMKTKFIADMSHEIRTPLNAVVGFSQMLANTEYEISDEDKKVYGEYIVTNNDILLKLIDDILSLSKLDAGKLEFQNKKVDIIELCKFAINSSAINLATNVEMSVKSSFDKLTVYVDKERILEVLFNLINNSIKNTQSGSIVIEVALTDEEKMIEVSVTDTGCGIPKEKAELVFQRFVKLDGFKQGTGLGLPICQSIIKKSGGRIFVDTNYTDGAKIVFTLPRFKSTTRPSKIN